MYILHKASDEKGMGYLVGQADRLEKKDFLQLAVEARRGLAASP